ncbi:MAG: pyruvate kinase [Bacteroidota bacterium]
MKIIHLRKTKIVATLGPACTNEKTLLEMVKAGMDVARLNFSHADHETHEKSLKMIRGINKKYKTNIPILQDLQGPKIRIGTLKAPFKVKPGDVVTIRADIKEQVKNDLPIQYETFAQDVKVGDPILIDDGKVIAKVVETNKKTRAKLEIISGEAIQSRKGVNLPQTTISVPTITEKDFRDIDFAVKHQVEWLALSFVRTADDVRLLKELIRLKNGNSKIISKIEKPEALENIDEIIAASDGIMVARGDLGVEIPLEEVPIWQKRIIAKSNEQGKPCILATQVMETMMENPRPTRAEASDVANALEDGADAVMLSGETSVGKYPVGVVSTIAKILDSVEANATNIYFHHMDDLPPESEPLSGSIILSASKLAEESNAKAIISMTHTGYNAISLSRNRPKANIYAFTSNRPVLNMLNLVWGVRAFFYDKFVSTDDTIDDVHEVLKDNDLVQPGDIIVNCGSMPIHERGRTNMLKVSRIRQKGEVKE